MYQKLKKISALFLAFVLTVSVLHVPVSAKSDRLPDVNHVKVDFNSLEYEHYDSTEFEEKIARIYEICNDPDKMEEITEIIEYAGQELLDYGDMKILASYFYEKNSTDEYWYTEYTYTSALYARMASLMLDAFKELLKSPLAEELKVDMSEEEIQSILGTSSLTDEQMELIAQYNEILSEWYSVTREVEFEGASFTDSDIYTAFNEGSITAEEYNALIDYYREQKGIETARLYLRLIDTNNKLAQTFGYDNYLDYAYEKVYGRAYTPKDAMKTLSSIYEKLNTLYFKLCTFYDSSWLSSITDEKIKDNYVELLGQYVGRIAPELKESYDYMEETNALDIEPNGAIVNSSTDVFKTLNFPFICMEEGYDVISTFTTLVHEFGHYNSMYWRDASIEQSSKDLEEIYSQGLEMLFTNFYQDILGEAGQSEERKQLGQIMYTVYSTACIAETEYKAYTGEYKTPEELSQALNSISEKYYGYTKGASNWYFVSHMFDTPGYYVSYTMSALNALELYSYSKENYEDAVDRYIKLIANSNLPLNEAYKKAGITYKWTPKKINSLLDKLVLMFNDTEAPVIEGVEEGAVYPYSPVKVSIKDLSEVYISLTANDEQYYYTDFGREFEVKGANGKYNLLVMDNFGNTSSVSFEVTPRPWLLSISEGKNGAHEIKWRRLANATSYKIYGAPLGKKLKLLGTVDGSETEFVNKKADDRIWKYYIAGYIYSDGTDYFWGRSYNTYMVNKGNEKYTNASEIDITNGDTLKLKKGKTKQLTVTEKLDDPSEKQFTGKKVKAVRYFSVNENVATVSVKGKVTAVGKGECLIYAVSENGLTDVIKVKVS